MNAIIKFQQGVNFGGDRKFKTNSDVVYYFEKTLSKQREYFYFSKRIRQIEKDDVLYFAFEANILVVAQYTGKYKEIEERDFAYGYQIKNLKILKEPLPVDYKVFNTRSLAYVKTDEQRDALKDIIYQKIKNEIKIKSLKIENFTLFNKNTLKFSEGINVLIGENNTGKSQILKLLYSIININNENRRFEVSIVNELEEVFRPTDKNISKLISFGEKKSFIEVDLSAYEIAFNFTIDSNYEVNKENIPQKFYKKEALFIPAKEILSHFKGFIGTYNRREIAFDKITYDLAMGLDIPLLKNQSLIEQKNIELEEILQGEIVQLNGEFYLRRFKDRELVVSSMMAEGLRKIGTISYLLKNGSLNENSILFWDEPEATLNPKLIKDIAKLLLYLESLNIQIFIATHSLFLVRELEILREKKSQLKYFGFGFDEKNNLRVSDGEEPSELEDIVFLDESLSQSSRYLNKKNA